MERTKIKDIYIKTNEIKIETVWLFNFYQILLYVLLLLLILLQLLSSIFHIINKCDRSYMYIDYQWLCTQHKIKWLFVDWYHFWLLKINVTNTNTLKNIFNAFTTLILRNMRILRITISFYMFWIFDDKKFYRPKCHQTCWMSLYLLSANHKPPL